ncbi:hypothetical protein GBAR_LOCUS23673, partial [Geodia barretti]
MDNIQRYPVTYQAVFPWQKTDWERGQNTLSLPKLATGYRKSSSRLCDV